MVFRAIAAVVAAAATVALVFPAPCGARSEVVVPWVQPFGDFPSVVKFRERKLISALAPEVLNVTVSSDVVDRLVIGQRVVVNVTIAGIANRTADWAANQTAANWTLRTRLSDLRVLRLVGAERRTLPSGSEIALSIVLEGADIGYSFVRFGVDYSEESLRPERNDVLVSVVRSRGVLNQVSEVFLYAVPIIGQLAMGSQVDLGVVKSAVRRPKALLTGLGCQYTIMPLLAYGVLTAMQWRGGVALGFFALGCAPGGGLSNLFTTLLGGDVTLSVAMTLLSTMSALGFVPLWMFTLGATLPPDEAMGPIHIPFENMATSLAITIGPLFVGLLIQFKLPRVTAFIAKVIKPVFLVIVVITYALIFFVNSYVFDRFDASLVLSSASLPIGGFLISMFVAYAVRLEWKVIKTVAIETGIQNAIIASIIVNWSLRPPASDLALIPVTAAAVVGPSPLVILCVLYTIYRKCVERRAMKKLGAANASACLASHLVELPTQKQSLESANARPDDGGAAERLADSAAKPPEPGADGARPSGTDASLPSATGAS